MSTIPKNVAQTQNRTMILFGSYPLRSMISGTTTNAKRMAPNIARKTERLITATSETGLDADECFRTSEREEHQL